MSSTFGILEAARSGLSVSMENLKITGHNIANADTVGYTRQRLITSAKEAANSVYLIRPTVDSSIARGVEVLSIQQLRSAYLDNQYRDLNSGFAYSDATVQSLTYLQGLFNPELEKGKGLTGSIERFFSSLNTFATDTTSEENRIAVQKSAVSLTQNFNLVYQEMEALWTDQNDSIATTAQTINSTAQKLAELNKAIANYERSGQSANDLRDERNLLLDELSGYVNITYCDNDDQPSMVDVYVGGLELVSGTTVQSIQISKASDHAAEIDALTGSIASTNAAIAAALGADPSADVSALQTQLADYLTDLGGYLDITAAPDAATGITDVTYHGATLVSGGVSTPVGEAVKYSVSALALWNRNNLTLGGSALSMEAGTVTGGRLFAHMEQVSSSDTQNPGIPYYMEQLNALARSIAQNINDIHLTGYSYDTDKSASTTTSKTGIYFFDVETDVDAGGAVTAEYYSKITAGNFSVSDAIAESVWNIAGSSIQVHSDGTTTDTGNSDVASALYADLAGSGYYGKLNSIVGHLSIALDTNKSLLDTRESLLGSIDTQRASVSGVSVNEETTNLIVFQQSFNACSRMITAIDEMLETMISKMGLVGR